jgi:hypothetical protein
MAFLHIAVIERGPWEALRIIQSIGGGRGINSPPGDPSLEDTPDIES